MLSLDAVSLRWPSWSGRHLFQSEKLARVTSPALLGSLVRKIQRTAVLTPSALRSAAIGPHGNKWRHSEDGHAYASCSLPFLCEYWRRVARSREHHFSSHMHERAVRASTWTPRARTVYHGIAVQLYTTVRLRNSFVTRRPFGDTKCVVKEWRTGQTENCSELTRHHRV